MIRDFLNLRAYDAHEGLVSPARPKAQLWRLVMGIILIAGVILMIGQFVNQTLMTILGPSAYAVLVGADGNATQISVLYLLATFGFLTLGVIVALRVAHHRGVAALLGDWALFRRQFLSVLAMLFIINLAIAVLPPWDFGVPMTRNVTFGAWLLVLPVAVVAVLIQVSAEEILFRGYLQQQLAARFSSPALWMILPSALFGLGHYMPQVAGENALMLAVWAGLFGCAMADITARAGTLGPAIAIHFAHNAVAILFVSIQDELSGLALYSVTIDLADSAAVGGLFPIEFMMILVSWLGARLAIRR